MHNLNYFSYCSYAGLYMRFFVETTVMHLYSKKSRGDDNESRNVKLQVRFIAVVIYVLYTAEF